MAAASTSTVLNLPVEDPARSVFADYDIGRVLGTGAFSTVREGIRKSDQGKVALKIINATKYRNNPRNQALIRTEIEIMRHLSSDMTHASLIRMFDVYEEPTKIVIVLEHLSGGELFDRIVERGHYSEQDAAQLIASLVGALHYCHNNGILHRDMKPENCIYETKGDDAAIKITDFGLAEMHAPNEPPSTARKSLVGTPGYVAPEVLESRTYTPACDIWSLGVILYILLVGYPPFYADHNAQLFEIIKRGLYEFHEDAWGGISDGAKDLVRQMLTVPLDQRITAEGVLAHPWVSRYVENPSQHLPATIERLVAFNAKRKFRAAAMACVWGATLGIRRQLQTFVAESQANLDFGDQELAAIKGAFQQASPTNGTVTPEQFEQIMTSLGFGELPLRRLYELFDKDGDHSVDYKEFCVGIATLKRGDGSDNESSLRFCFDVYDEDSSGTISREELVKVLAAVGESETNATEEDEMEKANRLAQMFERIDTDHDGQISFDEFRQGVRTEPILVRAFLDPAAHVAEHAPTTPAAAAAAPAPAAAGGLAAAAAALAAGADANQPPPAPSS